MSPLPNHELITKRVTLILGPPLAPAYESLSTHPPVEAGMNPAFFRVAATLRELVETERRYVKNLELMQVIPTTQLHTWRSF
jgi:hypothetical protein